MNQEDHIEKVVTVYHRALTKNKVSFELIGVVNCSRDKSYEIGVKLSKKLPHVTFYELKDCGFGLGILHGLKKAKGEFLCYLNCARVHSPDLILCLKHFTVDDKFLVHGIRMTRKKIRKIGTLLYNTLMRVIFKIPNRDIGGNPNIFSRENYNKLKLSFTDSMIDVEILEKSRMLKIPVIEVPVFTSERHGGHSTSNIKTVFRLLKEATIYWLKTRVFSKI
ncbi:hypothetical protein A3D76_05935 [Candidatus Roizmanbacteria bacterium RIFCSPHIGHO2_02_FULL_37_9b]|nr:MAG: hypothetical protein A3D76_05935 [Candidatus Roizmanbacteria bacterium RIFCSPHIGHO2_02_FULL_37_9b]